MILARKDYLKIKVRIDNNEDVNISLVDMEDVKFLWESWVRQEERLAQLHLQDQLSQDLYPELVSYLEKKGWVIEEIQFSKT